MKRNQKKHLLIMKRELLACEIGTLLENKKDMWYPMSSTASADTRDFVPFNNYYQLSVENIKSACKEYYYSPRDFCDLLGSDREPS